ADVREQLELEPHGALFAQRAGLCRAWGLVPRGGEVDVALAAHAALREHEARAIRIEIDQRLVRFVDHRPDRNLDHEVVAGGAVLILVAAVLAAVRLVVALVFEVEQRRQRVIGHDDDAASVAAVAAGWTAAWYTILAPERGGAVSAVAGLHLDDGLVDELHGGPMTDMAPSAAARQPAAPTNRARPMRWITAWTRAVVVPASRRAAAAMLGAGLIAAVVFGPTAMRPSDLTGLALGNPAVGAVLAATWLLVFVPTARMIVRPPVGYLYSLPGDPWAARAVAAVAL